MIDSIINVSDETSLRILLIYLAVVTVSTFIYRGRIMYHEYVNHGRLTYPQYDEEFSWKTLGSRDAFIGAMFCFMAAISVLLVLIVLRGILMLTVLYPEYAGAILVFFGLVAMVVLRARKERQQKLFCDKLSGR